jgi:hypothetical protein
MTILGRMVRRRRFEFAYLLGSLLLLPASLHSPTAYAAPGDPPAGSPAGAVYQLPLEQGRADAAPKGGGGTEAQAGGGGGSGGAGQSESDSLYRSENNFGSSSRVPGVAAAGADAGGAGTAAGAAGAGGQSGGGAGAGAGGAPIAGGVIAAETADTGNTSIPASIVLLGAIALLAIAVGILSRRFRAL